MRRTGQCTSDKAKQVVTSDSQEASQATPHVLCAHIYSVHINKSLSLAMSTNGHALKGTECATCYPKMAQAWPKRAHIGQHGRNLVETGETRSKSVQRWSHSGPMLVKVNQIGSKVKLHQIGTNTTRIRPYLSATNGRIWCQIRPSSTEMCAQTARFRNVPRTLVEHGPDVAATGQN